MDNSPLRRLPNELLNDIYERAFTPSTVHVRANPIYNNKRIRFDSDSPKHPGALLMTCREIRAQSQGVFFGRTSFIIYVNAPYQMKVSDLYNGHRVEWSAWREFPLLPLRGLLNCFAKDHRDMIDAVADIGSWNIWAIGLDARLPWLLLNYSTEVRKLQLPPNMSKIKFVIVYFISLSWPSNRVECTIDCYKINESLQRISDTLKEMSAEDHRPAFNRASRTFRAWRIMDWDRKGEALRDPSTFLREFALAEQTVRREAA